MTQTRQWLENRRSELARAEGIAVGLTAVGGVLLAVALGVVGGRLGFYRAVPFLVFVAWIAVGAIGWYGIRLFRRRLRAIEARSVAAEVEATGGLRRGSLVGMADDHRYGSASLVALADRKTAAWLEDNGLAALGDARRRGQRALTVGASATVIGAGVLLTVGPATGGGFWHPFDTVLAGRGPVTIAVDREEVQRGDSVVASIVARGRSTVDLFSREPGEAWERRALTLDTAGTAVVTLGPLQSDRFVRAASGGRSSRTVHVRVALPVFLADLSMRVRYPRYLERADEQLFPGDSVWIPVGSQLLTEGQVTVPVNDAAWHVDGVAGDPLEVDGNRFRGEVPVATGGAWSLVVTPRSGTLEGEAPLLHVVSVPDSLPTVTIPFPGVDTVAPATLRQSLVIDVRDDHRVVRVELESRRVNRLGVEAPPVVEEIPLPVGGSERAVLPWALDLNARGFLPGDTAFYFVRVVDNRPGAGQRARTREYLLRLPSQRELREDVRDQADRLVEQADSLAEAQRELAREAEEMAAAGARRDESGEEEGLDFESAERAGEISEEQSQLAERAEELARQLEELSESGWEAGVTDPEWQEQLREVQGLMERAITPQMQEAMEQLNEALEQLDPEQMREALERLAESQQQAAEQFERSRELLERAALEGTLETLADDAEELADRQRDWNEAAAEGTEADSALAAQEQRLADEANQLEQELSQVQEALTEQRQDGETMQDAQQRTSEAAQQMQQAAEQQRAGESQQAQQSGERASQELSPVAQQLREELEQMREDWRDEVMSMLDVSLAETADLARREQELSDRLSRGEAGDEVRGDQAAVREGVDQVIQRLQDAAGKNALVSPNLSAALGFARLRMTEALEQFAQPTPNTRQAAEMASQAVDGLNAVAAALLRSRGDVESASSGSGMAEAMERMSQMAEQQESLNGETNSLLPQMQMGGQELMQQLQEMANRQQELAEELERMAAEDGMPDAAEELAEEAAAIAEELAAAQLDRETIQRQEELFRNLLDAGRSLRSEEEDEREERQSETADQTNVVPPPELDPSTMGPGVRYPYPAWDVLKRFSPEERRLILDYFRRLNGRGS